MLRVFAGCIAATVLLNFPALAHAERVKIVIDEVTVQDRKANGKPWDGMGGPPDIMIDLAFGVGNADECLVKVSPDLGGVYKNRYKVRLDHEEMVEFAEGETLCVDARIIDKDAMQNDLIGRRLSTLIEGFQAIKVGQAFVHITVTSPERSRRPAVAAPPPVLPPAPAKPNKAWLVTVVSAEIQAGRPDKTTWDEPHDQAAEEAEAVKWMAKAGLAIATGGTTAILGALADGPGGAGHTHQARTNAAPDPFIEATVGGKTFSGGARRNTFAPEWNSTFVVHASPAPPPVIKFSVLDADGSSEEPIGSDVFPLPPLLAKQVAKPDFGSVDRVTVTAEPIELADTPLKTSVTLNAGELLVDPGVEVHAGQTVRITAEGEHCVGGRCVGPEGDPTRTHEFDGERLAEGQLVAFVGRQPVPIGRGHQFTAPRSGPIYLGLLNREASSGKLDVDVTVFHPVVR